jgi:hypothetical protein
MGLTHQSAWLIFKSDKLGQPEGKSALAAMTGPEFQAYECLAEDFEFELAKIAVEANNEAAAIIASHPTTYEVLEAKKPWEWNAYHYRLAVTPFEGSKYEQLHLSAMFRIANNELLLDLIRPST